MVRRPSPAMAVICAMISSFIWSPRSCARGGPHRVNKQHAQEDALRGPQRARGHAGTRRGAAAPTCIDPSLAMYEEHMPVTISEAPLR